MKQATLCFLIKKDEKILLAFKKKGFGAGKWNGVGGKLDSKKDKDIFEVAIREMEEEIGIKVKDIEKMAILNFSYPYLTNSEEREWQTHVFFAKDWQGEPKESEEMKPRWFKFDEIPFNKMWPDDKFWLPKVLAGEKVKADFIFKKGEIISSHNIRVVNKLD